MNGGESNICEEQPIENAKRNENNERNLLTCSVVQILDVSLAHSN